MPDRSESSRFAPLALLGLALSTGCEEKLPTACPAAQNTEFFKLYPYTNEDGTCHLRAVGVEPSDSIVVNGLEVKDSAEWATVHDYASAFTAAINAVEEGANATIKHEGKEVELKKGTNGGIIASMTIASECRCGEDQTIPQPYDTAEAAITGLPAFLEKERAAEECPESTVGHPPFKVSYKIISGIGASRDGGTRKHQGEDIKGIAGEGKQPNVYPSLDGIVKNAGYTKKRAGNRVIVSHGNIPGLGNYCSTTYAHMKSILVTEGQSVTWDTPLGIQGETGNAESPHLHMEFRCQTPAGDMRIYPPSMLWEVGANGPQLSCEEQKGSVYTEHEEAEARLGFTTENFKRIKEVFTIKSQVKETESTRGSKKPIVTKVIWTLTKISDSTALPPFTIEFFTDGITLTRADPVTGLETLEYNTSDEAVAGILELAG